MLILVCLRDRSRKSYIDRLEGANLALHARFEQIQYRCRHSLNQLNVDLRCGSYSSKFQDFTRRYQPCLQH